MAALDSPKVVGGGAFVSPFEWNENSTVIIKYKHGGGHIRAHPHNHELCDHKGGQTEWAKWKVHLQENGRIAQLEHAKTHKYLQMDKFVTSINVASEGGNTSRWIVHPMGSNCVRLESERNLGYFLGVKPHDGVTVVNAKNLDEKSYQYQFTYLYFFIEGQKDEGYFKKPYLMKEQNTIIIKHPQNASLRTNPNDERELDINGQKEMNARWEVVVTTIDSNDTKSNTNTNSNDKDNNTDDTTMTTISSLEKSTSNNSEKGNENSNVNDTETSETEKEKKTDNDTDKTNSDETIPNGTINESNDKSENSNENNNSKTDDTNTNDTTTETTTTTTDESVTTTTDENTDSKEKENQNESNDKNSREKPNAESKDDDSDEYDDSHEKTNTVLQFRSVKSGGFIKLDDNKITMSRKGDDFTKFRVYIVQQPNIVKLESTKHLGSYIRVTTKRGIHVGKGGPHCQMTLLRME